MKAPRLYRRVCKDCGRTVAFGPKPSTLRCPECCELGRVLTQLHGHAAANDRAGRGPGVELRVELYREVIARGGRLFE